MRWVAFTALLLLAPGLAGCLQSDPTQSDGPVVYASFYPLQFFTRELVGDAAEVRSLIPVGAAPHDYEPGLRDIAAVGESRAFVYLGYDFEPWLDGVVENAATADLHLIRATEGLNLSAPLEEDPEEHARHVNHTAEDEHDAHEGHDEHAGHGNHTTDEAHGEHADDDHNETHAANETADSDGHADEHDASAEDGGHGHAHDGRDPHVWLDPVASRQMVHVIADGLVEAFPEHEATILANRDNLTADLGALHHAFEEGLADCEKETILVSHNAYGHLSRRYGFDVASVSGLTPGGEPSARHVQRLVDFAEAHDIRILFREPLVSAPTLEVVADEVDGEVRTLYPLEGLTAEQQAAGLGYFDVQQENLHQLREALACR